MPVVQKSLGISKPLLAWYDKHARELPWRVGPADRKAGIKPEPYRVWLSEIMLQQTTVATVTPRYQQFLYLWPDLRALACASQEDVLAAWAGLGYYARARNLHKCAQVLVDEYNEIFPKTAAELQALPGIGPYTAAAIASIAFDEPATVMDGNVERVMARLFNIKTPLPDAKPALKEHTAGETPGKRPGDHAQALMDLGATICTPRNPVCALCPLNNKCKAFAEGTMQVLPAKKKKARKPTRYGTAFIIRRKADQAVFLMRRPEKGLLGGMMATPATEWSDRSGQQPTPPCEAKWRKSDQPVLHTFTHFHLVMDVWEAEVTAKTAKDLEGVWTADPLDEGLPTVFRKVFENR